MKWECFACGKKVGDNPYVADTRDDQIVFVGRECFKLIAAGGEEEGYQPPLGGPRLYCLKAELSSEKLQQLNITTKQYRRSIAGTTP
jgi:hypothetical protein